MNEFGFAVADGKWACYSSETRSRKTRVRAICSPRLRALLRPLCRLRRSVHPFLKCLLKRFHLRRCAYRHSHMCRPCWPHSPDVHFFSFHGFNELLPRPLHIHHETVAFGRNEGISIRREPPNNVVSNGRVNLLSFDHQALGLQSTLSRYNCGHRPWCPTIELCSCD